MVWSIYYALCFCSYFGEFLCFLFTEDVCVCFYFTDGDIVVGVFWGDFVSILFLNNCIYNMGCKEFVWVVVLGEGISNMIEE